MEPLGIVWIQVLAVKSLERVSGDYQARYELSRKSLGTSRIAVQSLGRVWIPTG